jgi:hypothetical protein
MAVEITKRHPIRGFIYGIFFGLGLAFLAIGQGWAALGTLPPVILVIIGIIVGTLWGRFAPAKKPKGEPPPERVHVENVASRFDDFEGSETPDEALIPAGVDQIADEIASETADGSADAGESDRPDSSDDD